MGIDFSYILYFVRKKQWDALQALVDIALLCKPLTKIIFPDREIIAPLSTWSGNIGMIKYDESGFALHFSIYFKQDEVMWNCWNACLVKRLPFNFWCPGSFFTVNDLDCDSA